MSFWDSADFYIVSARRDDPPAFAILGVVDDLDEAKRLYQESKFAQSPMAVMVCDEVRLG